MVGGRREVERVVCKFKFKFKFKLEASEEA